MEGMTDQMIQEELAGAWDTVLLRNPCKEGFHDFLRDELVEVGVRLGFQAHAEFQVGPVYHAHKRAFIDVIWRDQSDIPRLLLEIDDGSNIRAIKKLLDNQACLRIWFGYGQENTFLRALKKHAGPHGAAIVLLVKPSPFG